MRRSIVLFSTTALALTLAACGGGSGDTTSDTATDATATDSATDAGSGEATDTASGDSTAGAATEGSLTVWVDENRMDAVQQIADMYTADTGVQVELVQKNNEDIQTDFLAQVPTGEGPDITVGAHDYLGAFVQNGVVAPIELGDAASGFNESAIGAFTQDGQVYGVPYAIESVALIRNADLVPDAAPATFDEMIAAGQAAGTQYPFVVQVGDEGDAFHMYPFQTSFGAPVFVQNEDGSYTNELGLGGEAGQAFATWLGQEGSAGILDTALNADIAKQQFIDGNTPFIISGPWLLTDLPDGMNVAVDPIPSAGGETAQPFSTVQGFYINAQSPNQILANDFLVNYVGSEEGQLALFEAGQRPPALTAAAESEEVTSDPVIAGFVAQAETAVPMPSIPEMAQVWAFWGVTEAQIIGGADPVSTWDQMVTDIQTAIDAG